MICPTLSINGTSSLKLEADLITAIDAISAAQTSLRACTPHGRDYSAVSLDYATEEHYSRVSRLADIAAELAQIMSSVQDQIDK